MQKKFGLGSQHKQFERLAIMKELNIGLAGRGTTIFAVMSALALDEGAINLGQGFPDEDGPTDIIKSAAEAMKAGHNQYPPMMGLPELRMAVADHNQRFYDLAVDWQSEVMVTSGATEALADCFLGILNPGDEVIVFEPAYDSYRPMIERAGATARVVKLLPPHWKIPMEKLAETFGPKTKAIVINTPMNPTGKVFSRDELSFIADLVVSHDAYAICDEVYEHLVFDGVKHIPIMSLPGMRERSVRIGSAGKTFSLTGWKIGYVTACEQLMRGISRAHQYVTYTTPPGLQLGVAYGLAKPDTYFGEFSRTLQAKRDAMCEGLSKVGFRMASCQGTYFVCGDYSDLGLSGTAMEVCRELTVNAKVASIPMSPFYSDDDKGTVLRFCFCKKNDVIQEASDRLSQYFEQR